MQNFPICTQQFSILPFTRNSPNCYLQGLMSYTMDTTSKLDKKSIEVVNVEQVTFLHNLNIPIYKIHSQGLPLMNLHKRLQGALTKITCLQVDILQNTQKGQKQLCGSLFSLYNLKPNSVSNVTIRQISHYNEELIGKLFEKQFMYLLATQALTLVSFKIHFTKTVPKNQVATTTTRTQNRNLKSGDTFERLKRVTIKMHHLSLVDHHFWEFFQTKSMTATLLYLKLDLEGCVLQGELLALLLSAVGGLSTLRTLKLYLMHTSGHNMEQVCSKMVPTKIQLETLKICLRGGRVAGGTLNYISALVRQSKPKLRSLRLTFPECGFSHVQQLGELFTVKNQMTRLRVDLGNNPIVLPNLHLIRQLVCCSPHLTTCQIDCSGALLQDDVEVVSLDGGRQLRELDLNLSGLQLRTHSQHMVVRLVGDFTYLRQLTLNVSNSRLHDATVGALVMAISRMKFLLSLEVDVRYNIIGGVTHEAVGALSQNINLVNVCVMADPTSERGCEWVVAQLSHVVRFKGSDVRSRALQEGLMRKRKAILWIEWIRRQCQQIKGQPQEFMNSFWRREFIHDSLQFMV